MMQSKYTIQYFLLFLIFQIFHLESGESSCFLTCSRGQGRNIGYESSSYSSIDLFAAPYHTKKFVPFLDARLNYFDETHNFGFNLGTGFRTSLQKINALLGVNAFYDHSRVYQANFQQVGLGTELFFDCWNFRCNGYWPVGNNKKLIASCLYDQYEGGYFIRRKKYVSALRGIDFEVEYKIFSNSCWGVELFLGIGGYFYKRDGCQKNVYGPSAKATAYFCNQWSFSFGVTNDTAFNNRVLAELNFTFPLRKPNDTDPRFMIAVQRQNSLVFNKFNRWQYNW